MKVYRKPRTAEWYYDSAQQVADVSVPNSAWTGCLRIQFDATKDKQGDRHTTIRVELSEADVERLHSTLLQGRRQALREATKEIQQLKATIARTEKALKKHHEELESHWYTTEAESEAEARLASLKDSLKAFMDANMPGWRWSA